MRSLCAFFAHLLPWAFVVSFVVLFPLRSGTAPTHSLVEAAVWTLGRTSIGVTLGFAFGLAFCIVGGAVGGFASGLTISVLVGLVGSLASGFVGGFASGLVFGKFGCLVIGFASGLVFGLMSGLAGGRGSTRVIDIPKSLGIGLLFGMTLCSFSFLLWKGKFAPQSEIPHNLKLQLVSGIRNALVSGLGFSFGTWIGNSRLYRLILPVLLQSRYKTIRDWRRHPAVWDRACLTPYRRMDEKYLDWWEREPRAVLRQLLRLIARNKFQRPAALEAFSAILARESAQFTSLSELGRHLEQLPRGEKGYLAKTAELRQKAAPISALQSEADATSLPLLRRDKLTLAREAIVPFRSFVSGCEEPLCSEFLRAADAWDAALARQIAALPQEVPDFFEENLYIQAGMQAFVRRDDTLAELVGHLRDEAGGASLLLYARRRMGKSTLTENLARMLPSDLAAIRLSLQDAAVNTSEAYFTASVIAVLAEKFPDAGLTALRDDTLPPRTDLATFSTALRRLQSHLETTARRVFISLDEYELMDERIAAGAMSVRLLAALRDAIQSHRRIRWLFSGVHHFSELPGAEWSSYLTAFRQVNVRPFSMPETHQLLTEPMRHAQAFGDRTPAMAGFFLETGFWPEPIIARIQHETQGWPALVQGVAKQVITLCNRAKVLRPTDEILEGALDAVLDSMATTFQQLLLFSGSLQDTEKRAGEYLRGFRTADTLPLPTDGDIRRLLERHELMTATETGEWRLRVPLMLRWMRKRG